MEKDIMFISAPALPNFLTGGYMNLTQDKIWYYAFAHPEDATPDEVKMMAKYIFRAQNELSTLYGDVSDVGGIVDYNTGHSREWLDKFYEEEE